MRASEAEILFDTQVQQAGLHGGMLKEYVFARPRKWRFDFAWPEPMVAVEIDGGGFVAGRHTRGKGFEMDAEKLNAATEKGWRVLRVTPDQVSRGEALQWLANTLEVALLGRIIERRPSDFVRFLSERLQVAAIRRDGVVNLTLIFRGVLVPRHLPEGPIDLANPMEELWMRWGIDDAVLDQDPGGPPKIILPKH